MPKDYQWTNEKLISLYKLEIILKQQADLKSAKNFKYLVFFIYNSLFNGANTVLGN